jgi:hypothetical protein
VTIRRPFGELDLGDQLSLSHKQLFISSLVKAHWFRLRSGSLANGFQLFADLCDAGKLFDE